MRWKRFRFFFGIVISLLCLWLAVRQVEWAKALAMLHAARWEVVVLGASLLVLAWSLFAARWQVLFSPARIARWLDAFSLVLIGYLGSIVFPLRAGDVARVTLMSQKYRVSLGFTSVTLVLARLLDVLTVVVFAGILKVFVPVDSRIRPSPCRLLSVTWTRCWRRPTGTASTTWCWIGTGRQAGEG